MAQLEHAGVAEPLGWWRGYKDMFLRRRYPVYLWDGPRVGRANWGCASHTYTPNNSSDQGNFTAWIFGPAAPAGLIPTPLNGTRPRSFRPTNEQAWLDATRSRYLEFDLGSNVGFRPTRQPSRPTPAGSATRSSTSPTPPVDFAPW